MNTRSIWLSLIWKEWREHRWKMASLVAIVVAVPLLVGLDDPGSVFFGLYTTMIPYVVLASFFLGAGAAAGEEANHTAQFLMAQPVPRWKPAAVKLAMAVLSGVVPIIIAAGGVYLWTLTWDWLGVDYSSDLRMRTVGGPTVSPGLWVAFVGLLSTLALVSLLIWVAACGVGRKDEISAGAWAVGISGIAYLVLFGVAVTFFSNREIGGNPILLFLMSLAPTMFVLNCLVAIPNPDTFTPWEWIAAVVAAVASHGLMVSWYLHRFGHSPKVRVNWGLFKASRKKTAWLGPPRRSQFTAIVWKQVRETLPVAAVGGVSLMGFSAMGFFNDFGFDFGRLMAEPTKDPRIWMGWIADHVLGTWTYVGFFVALVAGIGVFLEDLSPRLHTFWRSRPVHVDQWFWTKFAVGLAVPVGVMGGLVSIAVVAGSLSGSSGGKLLFLSALAIQVLTYCGAVAAVCLVRQPLYAAVLALCPWVVFFLLTVKWELIPQTSSAMGIFVAVMSVLCALVGWQALRRDIGWKR